MFQKNLLVERVDAQQSRVSGRCVFTQQEYSVVVPTAGLERWSAGELIQRALPGVPPEDREFLISGISPAGWRKTFGESEV